MSAPAPLTADPFVARLERNAAIWCVGVAAVTLLWTRDWSIALGVIGGGVLTAVSLFAIRSSVDALLEVITPAPRVVPGAAVPGSAVDGSAATGANAQSLGGDAQENGADGQSGQPNRTARAGGAILRLTGRYALLGVLAYAMIARLRLHPIGLLIGASSLVASAALEAVRVLTRARLS
jgi:hypothetical protein